MALLKNKELAEIVLRASDKCLSGIEHPPWDVEVYEGDPEAIDGKFRARWKRLTEQELSLAIRMLDYAGYDIVKRECPDSPSTSS